MHAEHILGKLVTPIRGCRKWLSLRTRFMSFVTTRSFRKPLSVHFRSAHPCSYLHFSAGGDAHRGDAAHPDRHPRRGSPGLHRTHEARHESHGISAGRHVGEGPTGVQMISLQSQQGLTRQRCRRCCLFSRKPASMAVNVPSPCMLSDSTHPLCRQCHFASLLIPIPFADAVAEARTNR